MTYALENQNEVERLEKQAEIKQYSLAEELKYLNIKGSEYFLDAGCGSGLLSRYLIDQFSHAKIDACDFSEIRIKQTKNKSKQYPYDTINFLVENLENLKIEDNKYDYIISRYVFEHLMDVKKVSSELYRVTKPGGKITIIDFDGVFANLFSHNVRFNELFDKVKKSFSGDLHIGRRLPYILKEAGFRNINYDVTAIQFKGKEAELEYQNNVERCRFCFDTFKNALGSEALANEFIELYLSESLREENTFFFNKVIVTGHKE